MYLEKIEEDCHVAALTREAGPAAAREDRRTKFSTERQSFLDVLGVARNDDTNRRLPIIGAVGCVEGSAAAIKADLTLDFAPEFRCERFGVDVRWI